MKITGVGRYIPGGVLYYITDKWPWTWIKQQKELHWALCDMAKELGCTDHTMSAERPGPALVYPSTLPSPATHLPVSPPGRRDRDSKGAANR